MAKPWGPGSVWPRRAVRGGSNGGMETARQGVGSLHPPARRGAATHPADFNHADSSSQFSQLTQLPPQVHESWP